MRCTVLLVLLAACPDKPKENRQPVVAVPPGAKLLVSKDCNLWPHPPSKYFYQDIVTYDLEAASFERTRVEGEEDAVPPPEAKKTSGKLEPATAQTIRARLDEVMAGGPYPQKLPPSGGGRCTLLLHGGDLRKPYLSVDRYEPANDAVDRLLGVL